MIDHAETLTKVGHELSELEESLLRVRDLAYAISLIGNLGRDG